MKILLCPESAQKKDFHLDKVRKSTETYGTEEANDILDTGQGQSTKSVQQVCLPRT